MALNTFKHNCLTPLHLKGLMTASPTRMYCCWSLHTICR